MLTLIRARLRLVAFRPAGWKKHYRRLTRLTWAISRIEAPFFRMDVGFYIIRDSIVTPSAVHVLWAYQKQ